MSGTRHSLQLSVAVGLLCLVTLTWASRESSPPQLPINRDFTSSSKHDESRAPGGELRQTVDDRLTNDGSNKQWPTHHTSRSSQDVEHKEEEEEEEGGGGSDDAVDFQWTIVSFAVIFVLISLLAIGCGIYMLCRKDNPDSGESGPGYSVAISNRLFKVSICSLSKTSQFVVHTFSIQYIEMTPKHFRKCPANPEAFGNRNLQIFLLEFRA